MAIPFLRVAHRGGSQLAPENTMAAFRNALTLGVDAIELDVHMSHDGHAVVFHDYTLERLTDGEGNIADLDFAYLRSLNAAAHFSSGWPQTQQIPTLREVLELAKNRVQVFLEIKQAKRNGVYEHYPHIAETVVNEIRAAGTLNQVMVMSFDWYAVEQVRALEPRLQLGALVSNEVWASHADHALTTLIERVGNLGVQWIHMDSKLFTHDMPTAAHENSFKLGIWTVNTLDEMRRFADAGVDALTSDRPDLFEYFK